MSDEHGMLPVRCGDVIADKFRVERPLGLGGMGAVVAARHLALGEMVALKFMRTEYCENRALLSRFKREARGMFRLKSEHVPRVFDIGSIRLDPVHGAEGAGRRAGAPNVQSALQAQREGRRPGAPEGHPDAGLPGPRATLSVPYIVMEYLQGNDLRFIVDRRGRIPCEEAAEYVRQACDALIEAHALGMVHRDLKPANLFLTYRADGTPLVKVLDFGVAKFTAALPAEDGLEMTTARTVMGSRRYMAPEQMFAPQDVDTRADVWGLGVVLYQLVSGQLPFEAQTMDQLVLDIAKHPPRPLHEVCPDVPASFEALVMRCLEKDRDRRPVSVGEIALTLDQFARRDALDATIPQCRRASKPSFNWADPRPPTTLVPPAAGPSSRILAPDRPTVNERRTPPPRRARATIVAGGVALAATVASLAAAVATERPRVQVPGATGSVALRYVALAAQYLVAQDLAAQDLAASPGSVHAAHRPRSSEGLHTTAERSHLDDEDALAAGCDRAVARSRTAPSVSYREPAFACTPVAHVRPRASMSSSPRSTGSSSPRSTGPDANAAPQADALAASAAAPAMASSPQLPTPVASDMPW